MCGVFIPSASLFLFMREQKNVEPSQSIHFLYWEINEGNSAVSSPLFFCDRLQSASAGGTRVCGVHTGRQPLSPSHRARSLEKRAHDRSRCPFCVCPGEAIGRDSGDHEVARAVAGFNFSSKCSKRMLIVVCRELWAMKAEPLWFDWGSGSGGAIDGDVKRKVLCLVMRPVGLTVGFLPNLKHKGMFNI